MSINVLPPIPVRPSDYNVGDVVVMHLHKDDNQWHDFAVIPNVGVTTAEELNELSKNAEFILAHLAEICATQLPENRAGQVAAVGICNVAEGFEKCYYHLLDLTKIAEIIAQMSVETYKRMALMPSGYGVSRRKDGKGVYVYNWVDNCLCASGKDFYSALKEAESRNWQPADNQQEVEEY
jgi:hypothetical protein